VEQVLRRETNGSVSVLLLCLRVVVVAFPLPFSSVHDEQSLFFRLRGAAGITAGDQQHPYQHRAATTDRSYNWRRGFLRGVLSFVLCNIFWLTSRSITTTRSSSSLSLVHHLPSAGNSGIVRAEPCVAKPRGRGLENIIAGSIAVTEAIAVAFDSSTE